MLEAFDRKSFLDYNELMERDPWWAFSPKIGPCTGVD